MTGWTLGSCNVGLHLGESQSEVICIVAYGKLFTGVTPNAAPIGPTRIVCGGGGGYASLLLPCSICP